MVKEDVPTGPARIPVFVVSDEQPETIPTKDKGITIMGETKTIQKFIQKDYVDELQLQLIPILLGD